MSKSLESVLKRKSIVGLVCGIVLTLISLPMAIIMVNEEIIATVFFGIIAAFGIFLTVTSAMSIADYRKSFIVRRNPNLPEWYEKLTANPVYTDDFFIVSDDYIGSVNNVCSILPRNDIVWAYRNITRTNGIPTSDIIKLCTVSHTIQVSIYGKKEEVRNQIYATVEQFCPNAQIGYSGEMIKYYNQLRSEYKKEMKAAKAKANE
ncbi:MAG: hypothetical protein LKG26_01245 [Saccharofermentans sp.]|jgi:hypothetical protein|nr:hypothetical protein [Mageeibacillus sp.]MCI1263668.1 hypothetical protein [Saccharofermentans sp.]MCI1274707.1 hypothetical protein [Saccharofermentans sp.]MCI2043680.1 hypothetical protein [Mageeibacillus sp.]